MKILHLFSNWKWTGPAEPAVNLCRALQDRHEMVFICGSPADKVSGNEVLMHCQARGLEPITGFRLRKHATLYSNFLDWMKLRKKLREEDFHLIHAHLPNDHLIAGISRRGLKKKPPIIRTFYGAEGPEDGRRTRYCLRRYTDGAILISQKGRRNLVERFGFDEARTAVIPAGVDTKRFDPRRMDRGEARAEFGLGRDDFVLGIVARMQRHRKFEILLEAAAEAMRKSDDLKLLIVGRGTHQEAVAVEPVKDMGLEDRILFTGYIGGEKYVNALAALDGALFLVPGSDGSCRAVREKMSMGLPVIAADVPPLDEMVTPGKTGMLVDVTVDGLKEAMLKMAEDRGETALMGENARKTAEERFTLEAQSAGVEEFYQRVLDTFQHENTS